MPQPVDQQRFTLRRDQPTPWWLWALSAVLHLPVLFVLFVLLFARVSGGWLLTDRADVADLAVSIESFALERPVAEVARPVQPDPLPTEVRTTAPARVPEPDQAGAVPPVAVPVPGRPGLAVVDTGSNTAADDKGAGQAVGEVIGPPALGPAFGSGILWGHRRNVSAADLAQEVLGTAQGSGLDSNTTARLQRYIDSMAVEAAVRKPPSWVTSLGGKQVGVDQQWIYLGPIRIPTAVLALLPIDIQVNPTAVEYNRSLALMRGDLYQAAQRASNYAEFRSNVDQLRREKEAEREFRKNQRGGGPLREQL